MAEKTRQDGVEEALRHYPLEGAEDAILTSWLVVCEWSSPTKGAWLSWEADPGMTPWKFDGMLEQSRGEWGAEEDDDDA